MRACATASRVIGRGPVRDSGRVIISSIHITTLSHNLSDKLTLMTTSTSTTTSSTYFYRKRPPKLDKARHLLVSLLLAIIIVASPLSSTNASLQDPDR